MLLEPVAELLVGRLLHERLHARVAELGLRLTFELGITQSHGDDRGQAFSDVLTEEVLVLLLEVVLRARPLVDHARERGAEAFLVRTTLDRADAVGERVDAVGLVAGAPLERELDLLAVLALLEVTD